MRYIFVFSGPIAVGKSSVIEKLLERFPGQRLSTRKALLARTGACNERGALQKAGDKLDDDTGGAWVAEEVDKIAAQLNDDEILVVDSIRKAIQIKHLKEMFGSTVIHVHLTAPDSVLAERYLKRPAELREFETYEEVRASQTEASVGELEKVADVVVDNERIPPETVLTNTIAKLGLVSTKVEPLVDVIVGAQYGSEGKGNICAHLAEEYDVLMRVGGPNAGHKVADPEYTYIQVPSGTRSNLRARILIGAGSLALAGGKCRTTIGAGSIPSRSAQTVVPGGMI